MIGYKATIFLCRVLACKGIGIIAIRQKAHLNRHALLQQHFRSSISGMNTSLITIV